MTTQRQRKTIEVAAIKDRANNMLAHSVPEKAEGRESIAILLERILMDTGNYKGFNYLDGYPCEDETRRHYY